MQLSWIVRATLAVALTIPHKLALEECLSSLSLHQVFSLSDLPNQLGKGIYTLVSYFYKDPGPTSLRQ